MRFNTIRTAHDRLGPKSQRFQSQRWPPPLPAAPSDASRRLRTRQPASRCAPLRAAHDSGPTPEVAALALEEGEEHAHADRADTRPEEDKACGQEGRDERDDETDAAIEALQTQTTREGVATSPLARVSRLSRASHDAAERVSAYLFLPLALPKVRRHDSQPSPAPPTADSASHSESQSPSSTQRSADWSDARRYSSHSDMATLSHRSIRI